MRSTQSVLRARIARAAALPLLVLTLLLGASSLAMAATDLAQDGAIVLATEAHGEDLPGPDPAPADAEENEFRPADYEANFLWGAAVGFGALVAGGVFTLGGLYWLMVVRPEQARANQPQG